MQEIQAGTKTADEAASELQIATTVAIETVEKLSTPVVETPKLTEEDMILKTFEVLKEIEAGIKKSDQGTEEIINIVETAIAEPEPEETEEPVEPELTKEPQTVKTKDSLLELLASLGSSPETSPEEPVVTEEIKGSTQTSPEVLPIE